MRFLRLDQPASLPPPIPRRNTTEAAPLSFAQERLWFLEQIKPDAAAYNVCRAYRLKGNLNVAALESGLNEIVRRHEVLRSSIRVCNYQPVQAVEPPYPIKLPVMDLQDVSPVERGPEIQQRIQQVAETPFDFAAGRFLRAQLLRLDRDEHVLILATHHIVSDAWSLGILTRELWRLYDRDLKGESFPEEEFLIQYADFAVGQRGWLTGQFIESQLSYWKRQLANLTVLDLPADRSRPARQSFHGRRVAIELSELLTSSINELSNKRGVTPFMTLVAAFQILLFRYSGQEDVVVGSPIANRRRSELETLVGLFVNILVLRSDLSGKPTFEEVIERVREVCLGAYAHQDLPFETLVHELQSERDQSRNPLFQVVFALQNATKTVAQPQGLGVEPIELDGSRSQFDLSLFLRERNGKYIGYFEYSTDLFDRDRIERMVGHFRTLLEGIIANPAEPISTLPILTDSERHQILVEWNDTAVEYPKDKCIHTLFEEQVERAPNAAALEFQGDRLTYRELNGRANKLAHYLIRLGVGPETLVGICVDRGLEMIVGILGILKAGGAYVPLDPAYPKERLRFILEDTRATAVITQQKYLEADKLPAVGGQLHYVCIDRDWAVIQRESPGNPHSEANPENLAYVIYTSGSTGQPKGVSIEHRNTVNLLCWAKTVYSNEDLQGVLASTSLCFDLSVFEIVVPLCWGGKIVLIENILCLVDLADTRGITLINTVPSAMSALLSVAALPRSARTVNLAGEALRRELVQRIFELGTVTQVYDLYGPSETTTYSTFTLRTADGPTTIGRPIANTQIYILDDFLQPVPVGVAGELYIGGDGVTRGYWNKPEMTAERIVEDPFDVNVHARMYRTGDRARYMRDGHIEFLGRADQQVKIRGYRVELGEIEAVLSTHPGIKECAVITDEASHAEVDLPTLQLRLVAYYTTAVHAPSVHELRTFLEKRFPNYMIPSGFIAIETMPVTPTGKVDRKTLPKSDHELHHGIRVGVPTNEVQKLLLEIWGDVLQRKSIGPHDNFFELGGHSLLAVQIIGRLRKAFDREVPLRLLFDAPTVTDLSNQIERLLRKPQRRELPSIDHLPRAGHVPLSLNQEHLWRIEQLMPGKCHFNIPCVYRVTGRLNLSAWESALKEVIRRHEALRARFVETESRVMQVIDDELEFELQSTDLTDRSAEERSEAAADIILAERKVPFDLTTGPLFRIRVVRITEFGYLLLVTIHHIISDRWSMQIFQKELLTLYKAIVLGDQAPLAGPTIQFTDYARWERELLENKLLDSQFEFWRKTLAAKEASLHPTSKRLDDNGRRQNGIIELDSQMYSKLKMFTVRHGVTRFIGVLAAMAVIIYLENGEPDIRVATLVANRRQIETHQTFGYFANTVILTSHISPSTTFPDLVESLQTRAGEVHENQELPFELLVRRLETEQQINRRDLADALLVYDVSTNTGESCGVNVAPVSREYLHANDDTLVTTFRLIANFVDSSESLIGHVNCAENFMKGDWSVLNATFRSVLEAVLDAEDMSVQKWCDSII